MLKITQYIHSQSKIKHLSQIKKIFLESTALKLDTHDERESAFKKWTDYYIEKHPEWIYLAIEEGECRAYVLVCPDSKKALHLKNSFNSYDLFEDQFREYPAHLHINAAKDFRGKGAGGKLIQAICEKLGSENSQGIHIVTSPEAENVKFYEKQGFSFHLQRSFNDFKLLFMGKRLV